MSDCEKLDAKILERLEALAPSATVVSPDFVACWNDACRTFAQRLAARAHLVYGELDNPPFEGSLRKTQAKTDTHSAILLDVQAIDKRVPLSEIAKALRFRGGIMCATLADQIEKYGVR